MTHPMNPHPETSAEKPMPLIAISGKPYSGKDSLAEILLRHLPGWRQRAIAQAIKQQYAQEQQLNVADVEAHKATHRPGLIALANRYRTQDPGYWLLQALELPVDESVQGLIFSDLRLRREKEILQQRRCFCIRVEASQAVRAQRGQLVAEEQQTECDLDHETDWNACIENNNALEALQETVCQELLPLIRSFF
ncbi:MAG: hypothetical protein SFZ03_12380 [Candidatus Melainabacteria bacterium]|nr:hypothetical protein [Candidatus Melainabacteria bacterium]